MNMGKVRIQNVYKELGKYKVLLTFLKYGTNF